MDPETLNTAAAVLRMHGPIIADTTGASGIEFIERRVYDELLVQAKALARCLEAIELENRHGK